MPGADWLPAILAIAAAAYVYLGALVVYGRLQFDYRRRLFEEAATLALSDTDASRPPTPALARLFSRASLRTLERGLSEAPLSAHARHLCALALLQRAGAARIEARAAGRARRWRRLSALRILTFSGAESAWPLLARALEDRDLEVVRGTVAILGDCDDLRSAVLLVTALRRGRPARSLVAIHLAAFPEDITDLVAPLLDETSPAARYWGAMLARRFPRIPDLEWRLTALVRDPDAGIRRAALEGLAVMGFVQRLPAVTAALDDAEPVVRAHAARAAARLGGTAAAALLVSRLGDKEWLVRDAIKRALEGLGPAAESALFAGLDAADEFAANGAAEVLQNIGTFERLLADEAQGPPDRQRIHRLEKLASAGGLRVWGAAMAGLPDTTREYLEARLASLERKAAHDGGLLW
ncbi:MAG: HEAT repeat domain-containing protein [Acidobacteriota bacterium]|nr:HEAT repeat domain-containing protein [Acidobacteriota bacterium]